MINILYKQSSSLSHFIILSVQFCCSSFWPVSNQSVVRRNKHLSVVKYTCYINFKIDKYSDAYLKTRF